MGAGQDASAKKKAAMRPFYIQIGLDSNGLVVSFDVIRLAVKQRMWNKSTDGND